MEVPPTRPFVRFSLRAKLALASSLIVTCFGAIGYYYIPSRVGATLREDQMKLAEGIAVQTSYTLRAALEFNDLEAVEMVVAELKSNPDVIEAIVRDSLGKTLCYRRFTRSIVDSSELSRDPIEVHEIIRTLSGVQGALTLTFSTQRVRVELERMRRLIGWFALTGTAIGVILSLAVGYVLTQPLQGMSAIARRISSGETSRRIEITSNDEAGDLAAAINTMVDRLVDVNNALELLNNALEARVKERTESLAIEVEMRRRKEEELVLANQQAQAANKAKSAFLAAVTHEFRTPLHALSGVCQLLASPNLDERSKSEFLAMGQAGLDQLSRLLSDVVDYVEIESGRLKLAPAETAFREFLETVVRAHKANIEEKGLQFELELATDLPDLVVTDARRLKQVLDNVLENATKYTSQGFVRFSVVGHAGSGPIETFDFVVTDSGKGMSAERFKEVVQPFSHLTDKYSEGLGLGLPLVFKLASALDGEFDLDATHSPGARFVVRLPFRTSRLSNLGANS